MISAADFAVAGPQLASLLGAEYPTTDAWQWRPLPSSVFRRSKVTAGRALYVPTSCQSARGNQFSPETTEQPRQNYRQSRPTQVRCWVQDAGYLTLQKDVISRIKTTDGQRAAQPAAAFYACAANGELSSSAAGGDAAQSALAASDQQPGHSAGSDCVSDTELDEEDPACLNLAETPPAKSAEQPKQQLHPGNETTSKKGLQRTYVYSILHSAAYNVPVLCFRGCTPGADTHRSALLLATVMLPQARQPCVTQRLLG